MQIDSKLTPQDLMPKVQQLFDTAGDKILRLDQRWNPTDGAPVITIEGKYTTRGWTEWTQGFQYGSALLTFEATDNPKLLNLARTHILNRMAPHITHTGVHDHGFNNISTYGNLRRLMLNGRIPHNDWELRFYNLALAASGSVQASRWSKTFDNLGFIYSFNGPHSLFIDTLRSLRSLAVAHLLGHTLCAENDTHISLLDRLITHALTTAKYNIYHGDNRDSYDTPATAGRTAHEILFNTNDGRFRCPSSQQGYSPFSTWMRGLAWAILGFAEQIEFISSLPESEFPSTLPQKSVILSILFEAARVTGHFYLKHAASDGIPYWDTGAPNLVHLGDYTTRAADPFNPHEPVDSSAAAIAAQGLLRLGMHYSIHQFPSASDFRSAALTIAKTLLAEPYLSISPDHEGLLLHSVYHRPNGWDHIPAGQKIPCGESSMWGDYHFLELALLIKKIANNDYFTFFDSPETA